MITPAPSVRILVAAEPVDFRKGIDGLAAVVQGVLASVNQIQADTMARNPHQARRSSQPETGGLRRRATFDKHLPLLATARICAPA